METKFTCSAVCSRFAAKGSRKMLQSMWRERHTHVKGRYLKKESRACLSAEGTNPVLRKEEEMGPSAKWRKRQATRGPEHVTLSNWGP